jgi:S1-C subfamily serine protease
MADPALRVASAPSPRQLTAEEIAEKCGPAVFYIEIYDANGALKSTGSGFFITSSGIAITNYHVVASARSAKIVTADGREYRVLGVYDVDEENDLALLQIDGKDFGYLDIGDSTALRNGAQIYAIGSPLGLQNTISPGIISNASRVINGAQYIQITAPLSPGSSGGALIDVYGNVIGVTSGTLYNGQGLNLAVPIDLSDALSRERYSDMRDFIKKTSEFYENSGNVPDFGYHFDVDRAYEGSDDEEGSVEYWYDTSELDAGNAQTLAEYGSLLREAGFRYMGTFREATDNIVYAGVYYTNLSTYTKVYCGVIASDDLEYIIVGIYLS